VRVENSPNSFVIKAAKSILIFDVSLVCLVVLLIGLSPITFNIKLLFILLVMIYGLVTARDFWRSTPNILVYSAQTNRWFYNQQPVELQPKQFLTAPLVILYLFSPNQKKITQVIPLDSLPRNQHIRLRKLIIAWSRTTSQTEIDYHRQS
jgi:hypothetical protein